jgi:hypothetical protein
VCAIRLTTYAANSIAATNGQPAATALATWPCSTSADPAASGANETSATHAWKRSGATFSICFIRIAPSDPAAAQATMNHSPVDIAMPFGFHTTRITPASVRAMPSPRRQWIRSPRITTDSKVVNGTPSWTTTADADGVAVCSPMNSNAKVPAPIVSPTATIRQSGRGTGRNHGRVTTTTIAKRSAA